MTYTIGDVIIVRHRNTRTALAVVTHLRPLKALKWITGAERWCKRPNNVEPLRIPDWKDARRHVNHLCWDAVEKEIPRIAARYLRAPTHRKE